MVFFNVYESSVVHRAIQPNGDIIFYLTALWRCPDRNKLRIDLPHEEENPNNHHRGRKMG